MPAQHGVGRANRREGAQPPTAQSVRRTASRRRSSSVTCRRRPCNWRRRKRFSSIRWRSASPLLALEPAGEDDKHQPQGGRVDHARSLYHGPAGALAGCRSNRGTLPGSLRRRRSRDEGTVSADPSLPLALARLCLPRRVPESSAPRRATLRSRRPVAHTAWVHDVNPRPKHGVLGTAGSSCSNRVTSASRSSWSRSASCPTGGVGATATCRQG